MAPWHPQPIILDHLVRRRQHATELPSVGWKLRAFCAHGKATQLHLRGQGQSLGAIIENENNKRVSGSTWWNSSERCSPNSRRLG